MVQSSKNTLVSSCWTSLFTLCLKRLDSAPVSLAPTLPLSPVWSDWSARLLYSDWVSRRLATICFPHFRLYRQRSIWDWNWGSMHFSSILKRHPLTSIFMPYTVRKLRFTRFIQDHSRIKWLLTAITVTDVSSASL